MTNNKNPQYEEIQPRSRIRLEEDFASGDPTVISEALYSAAQHEPEWRWTQARCLEMLRHESLLVRSSSLIALGEIALFRGELDVETVVLEMQKLSKDPALAPYVEDALDNIRAAGFELR